MNCMKEDICRIILPVAQHNEFYVHPENILYTMIRDDKKEIREMGSGRILKARKQHKKVFINF